MSETAASATSISIRPACPADRDFILEIYERVEGTGAPSWREDEPSPYSVDWVDLNLTQSPDDQAILIAEDTDGTLLGYTWVLVLKDFDAEVPRGHIAGVGVASRSEGRGIGARLVEAAEDWCRKKELGEVTLHCYIANERAHQLYSRLGFENEWYRMRKSLS
jgi:dTDP-4-amino-4,6-dideoxy-D-galactose acyltransferase